jgi:hypothetical protein
MQGTEHRLVGALFLRLFALVYLAAFVSFGVQARGLIGSDGILPLGGYIEALYARFGSRAWLDVPFVFWLNASDTAILAVVALGIAAALTLLAGRLRFTALVVLYVCYLSLFYAGQTFMTFQWDLLLIETGVIAMFLTRHPTIGVWLLRFLLFRFMFLSGVVKLSSGDPTWADLSALSYHFETQPLPTVLAWYADHLPARVLEACTATMFFIELVLPFAVVGPRRLRYVAGGGFVLLELAILLTGNYNFFNLLTLLLCLPLLDDRAIPPGLARWLPEARVAQSESAHPRTAGRRVAALAAAVLAGIALAQLAGTLFGRIGEPALTVLRAVAPLRIVNGYGLFAVMTTERDEIVIEGSSDGRTWLAYEFRYKPGDLRRMPGWVIPHQPRLDWQMWFAALAPYERTPWFGRFLECLLEGRPRVTALLARDPFAGAPPRHVRALLYRYRFSDPATRAATGEWWTRELIGFYAPPLSLAPLD